MYSDGREGRGGRSSLKVLTLEEVLLDLDKLGASFVLLIEIEEADDFRLGRLKKRLSLPAVFGV